MSAEMRFNCMGTSTRSLFWSFDNAYLGPGLGFLPAMRSSKISSTSLLERSSYENSTFQLHHPTQLPNIITILVFLFFLGGGGVQSYF